MIFFIKQPHRALLTAGLLATLAGCASVAPQAGREAVAALAQGRTANVTPDAAALGRAPEADTVRQIDTLLAAPLTADAAVRIALLNNPGLQARLATLQVSDADRAQAGRLPNPHFAFGRLVEGDKVELERALRFDVLSLLTLPWRLQWQERQQALAQLEVAQDLIRLAADTRKAWFHAVAAQQTAAYTADAREATAAAAELARRMVGAGNFSRYRQAKEQLQLADAAAQEARARQAAFSAREQLTRLLGLCGTQAQFTLPERLPDLPKSPMELPDIEQTAMAQRLDVQGAKLAAEQTAQNLGLTRATRFVNVLELGLLRNSSNEAPTQRGWEIGFELPLFDWGGARVARAEGIYMQTLHLAAETAINARSEVREAYTGYRSAYDIARHHRDEVVPLNQRIAEENVLRYNGMLIGVFELLADARTQITTVNASIAALRDFWIAQADLDMALIGKPNLAAAAGPAMATEASGAGH